MAVKDVSLNDKIIKAATAEFLEHGFRKASLRKIAERAGLTTGALYTRYENKDALFCSLVQDALKKIGSQFEPMRAQYLEAQRCASPEKLLAVIRMEEQIYLNIMFEHYDACVLFFCRSDGSSIETMLHRLMAQKAEETVAFLKQSAAHEIDLDGVAFIMSEQFHYYRQILEKGYSKEKAMSCMKTVEQFMEAGWKDLFERIMA